MRNAPVSRLQAKNLLDRIRPHTEDADMGKSSVKYQRKSPRQPDGRTREARLMRETREALTAHVGGMPSAPQRALIERATWLTLAVARLDAQMLAKGGLTDHASREYLAWSNTLTRTMRTLGLKAAQQRALTPSEAMAQHPLSRSDVAA